MVCQICGYEIKGKPYFWDDNPQLPMHRDMTKCGDRDPALFCDFMNRNIDFINRRGEPVLIEAKGSAT